MATNMTFTDGTTVIPADWLNFVNTAVNSAGGGTVTSVSVVTANGVSGSVATATTTPAITFSLGAITPTSVAVQGTAGAGFASFPSQSSNPTTPASGTVTLFAANAPSGITRFEMLTSTGATLAFFRDSVDTVRNETGSSIVKGKVVYINGANGTTPTIALAKADNAATAADIGVVLSTSIANNSYGTVQRQGVISGVDTSAWTAGDTLWVSAATAGALTNVEPAAPNFGMRVGTVVLSSVGAGIINLFVQPFVASKNYGSFTTLAVGTLNGARITPRVGSTTSSATPTINTDLYDIYQLTAQAADITSFTTNLTGTPVEGDGLIIEITGTAARAITWGTKFEASTIALPTTTVTTAKLSVAFLYNAVTAKWRCVGVC